MSQYPRNDLIQYAVVDYMKNATICSVIRDELSDTDEIREDQWQGTKFEYPAIRVNLIENKPTTENEGCHAAKIKLSIQVFSEDDSSRQSDRIAGIISSVLHGQQFSNQNINMALFTTNLKPAIRSEVWMAEVLMMGTASG